MAGSSGQEDVKLIFGVKGGGSIAGTSGRLIKSQLQAIADALNNSNKLKVKFNADTSVSVQKQWASDIKSLLNNINQSNSFKLQISKLSFASGVLPNFKKTLSSDSNKFEIKVSKINISNKALADFKNSLSAIMETLNLSSGTTVTVSSSGVGEVAAGIKSVGDAAQVTTRRLTEMDAAQVDVSKTYDSDAERAAAYKVQLSAVERSLSGLRSEITALGKAGIDTTALIGSYEKISRSLEEYKIRQQSVASGAREMSDSVRSSFESQINAVKKGCEAAREDVSAMQALNSTAQSLSKTIGGIPTDSIPEEYVTRCNEAQEAFATYVEKVEALNNADVRSSEDIANLKEEGKALSDSAVALAEEIKGWQNRNEEIKKGNALLEKMQSFQKEYSFLQDNDAVMSATGDSQSVTLGGQYAEIAEFVQQLNNANQAFNKGVISGEQYSATIKGLASSFGDVSSSIKDAVKSEEKQNSVLEKSKNLQTEIQSNLKKWTAARGGRSSESYKNLEEYVKQFQDLDAAMASGNITREQYEKGVEDLARKTAEASREIRNAGENTKAFSDRMKGLANKFASWLTVSQVVMQLYRAMRQMVTAVVEIDSAMTQLKIVTGSADTQMTKFLSNATSMAKELGQSISDILSSIETFSRLGYNLTDASTLAKYTAILANVASVDVEEATTGVTSIIKGYNMDVSNTEHVADVLVEVGQKYAVSASELMEAFEKSGAALSAANTSFEKSAGLIASANAAVQDASTVGTALKTISARIRGATSELEEMGEDTEELAEGFSKYADEIQALTGFSILEEGTTDTYKDIYDIFEGIAAIWDKLSDTQQSRVSEILGGTRQLQVVSSIIANWSDAAGAYASAMESAGVATEANATYMDSIEGRIGQFKAQFQELATVFVQSDFIKGVVSAGTTALELLEILGKIIESMGGLNTALSVTGGLITMISSKNIVKYIKSVITQMTNMKTLLVAVKNEINGVTQATNVMTKAQMATAAINWVSALMIALPIVIGSVKTLYDHFHVTAEEAHEAAEDLRNEYDELQSSIDDCNSELDTNKTRIAELQELSNSGTITLIEQEELERLKETNRQILEAIDNYQKLAEETAAETDKKTKTSFDKEQYNTDGISNDVDALYAVYQSRWLSGINEDLADTVDKEYQIFKNIENANGEESITALIDGYKFYLDLQKESGELTEQQAARFDDIKTALRTAYNDIAENYRDLAVGDEAKAYYQDILDSIYAVIEPAQHLTDVIDALPEDKFNSIAAAVAQYNKALEKSADAADGTVASTDDVEEALESAGVKYEDMGFTIDEVIAHINALAAAAEESGDIIAESTATISDALSVLADNEEQIKSLSDALDEFAEGGIVTAGTLNDLVETFGELDSFEAFVGILSDTDSTIEDVQAACNKLAAEYLNSSDALKNLNEDTANVIAAQLEQIGVTNAQAVVQEQLRLKTLQAGMADGVLENSEWGVIVAELERCGATEDEIAAIKNLMSVQYASAVAATDFANATADDVTVLYNMASACGVAAEKLAYYQQALSAIKSAESYESLAESYAESGDSYNSTVNQRRADAAREQAEQYLQQAQEEINAEDLKVEVPFEFDFTPTSSSSSGSSSAYEATEEIEEYIAEIDKYREAKEKLSRIEIEASRVEDQLDNSGDLKEQIALQRELIDIYEQEQEALHVLNDQRRTTIAEGVAQLQELGFAVEYNADTNELWIDNLEHLNELLAGSAGEYDTVEEATNALREETEDLVNTITELNEDNQDSSDSWWELKYSIQSAHDEIDQLLEDIVEQASDAVDELQDVYDTLHEAADEYAASGFITVDTLQSICTMGAKYLAYLSDENGQLTINEESIQKIIAARTEEMAVETALSYIEALKIAKTEGDTEALNDLLYATEEATDATWQLAYASLAALGLSEDDYEAALNIINSLRALADEAINSIGKETDTVSDSLETMKDGLDSILEYTMDMIEQEINNQIDALEDEKEAYSDLIDLMKKQLEAAKDEADYEDEVADKVKEIAKLQSQINALSLDDSREAAAQRASLEEELAELQAELADTQADYALEAQESALDDMVDAYEEEKDEEIAVLEDSISSYQKLYDLA